MGKAPVFRTATVQRAQYSSGYGTPGKTLTDEDGEAAGESSEWRRRCEGLARLGTVGTAAGMLGPGFKHRATSEIVERVEYDREGDCDDEDEGEGEDGGDGGGVVIHARWMRDLSVYVSVRCLCLCLTWSVRCRVVSAERWEPALGKRDGAAFVVSYHAGECCSAADVRLQYCILMLVRSGLHLCPPGSVPCSWVNEVLRRAAVCIQDGTGNEQRARGLAGDGDEPSPGRLRGDAADGWRDVSFVKRLVF